MDQTDAAMSGVYSATRALLIAIGGALVTAGLISKTSVIYQWIMIMAGAVVAVGPAAYNFYTAVTRYMRERQIAAKAVGAGINLVLAQKAVAEDGTIIDRIGAGSQSTPPRAVTLDSAAKIVKDFAPAEPAKPS